MNALVNINTALTMSSREIAELVESRHDSVKRTIDRLSSGVICLPPLVEYLDPLGRPAHKQSKFTPRGVEWVAGEYAKHMTAKALKSQEEAA